MSDPRDPARGYPGTTEQSAPQETTREDTPRPDDVVDEFARLQAEEYGDDPAYADDLAYADEVEYADEDDVAAAATTRSGLRARDRDRRRRRGRRLRAVLVLVVAIAVVATAGVIAVGKLRPLLDVSSESDDYPGPGTTAVSVTVDSGDTASAIATKLQAADVVKTTRAFTQAASADPRGTSIQPGSYDLKKQMKATEALAVLVDPANRSVPRVTIREGLWKSETFAALSQATGVPVADYVAAAKDTASLGLPAAAKGNLEGYLFPATYEFAEGSTAAEQLQEMVAKAVQEFTALGLTPETMERTVIIASIVEAEGRREEDRPKIARVIENRLAIPMRLQLDSTVSYGVQKRAITTTDAERAANNGYNTYARDGLPVGPIGNPGASSLQAAISPAAGPWIYFVAVNPTTGETKFATTDAEHQANVAEFQQWCSDNPGKC